MKSASRPEIKKEFYIQLLMQLLSNAVKYPSIEMRSLWIRIPLWSRYESIADTDSFHRFVHIIRLVLNSYGKSELKTS